MQRFHDRDWIKQAEEKGVLTPEEARDLADLRELVARVIAVDDFPLEDLARNARSGQSDGPSNQHLAAE